MGSTGGSLSSTPSKGQFILIAHYGFSCFCLKLDYLSSIEKKTINFSQLQTVDGQTSIFFINSKVLEQKVIV